MFRMTLATTVALVAIAAPASASPHTLNIESAATTTFDTPTLFYVYGTDAPPSDLGGDFWIEIVDLPGEIIPACPFGHQDALGFAENLPGQILDISLQPDRAVSGDFSNPIIFRPLMPHRNLICAYTHDGAGTTLARAAAVIDVQPAATANPTPEPTATPTPQPTATPTPQPTATPTPQPIVHNPAPVPKPVNTARPSLTKTGRTATCGKGTWDGALNLAFAWQIDGRHVRGATKRTLGVVHLRGHHVRCAVTGSNAGGATTALSRSLKV
jgi:hypothetical protein